MTGAELDSEARTELRTLPKDLATLVARHLVMAGRLIEEDPETAYRHAKFARRFAARVGAVREACGLAAYRAAHWSDALNELRTARRLTGSETHLPVMADCERGMGRPERALELARSAEAGRLDPAGRIEMRIVESGARRDLDQLDAAVVALQIPELEDRRLRPWSARLFYAYADALEGAGRQDEAREWFARAAAADRADETDAAERYVELEGLEIIDLQPTDAIFEEPSADEPPASTSPAAGSPLGEATTAEAEPPEAPSPEPRNAGPRDAELRGVESRGVESRGVESEGVEAEGVQPRVEPADAAPGGLEPEGVEPEGAEGQGESAGEDGRGRGEGHG